MMTDLTALPVAPPVLERFRVETVRDQAMLMVKVWNAPWALRELGWL